MRHCLSLLLMVFLSAMGCGGASTPRYRSPGSTGSESPATPSAQENTKVAIPKEMAAVQAVPPAQEVLPRKIIYTADARLVVEDFEKAEQELMQLLKMHKGYVAKAETSGKSGVPRHGHWKVRIPVEQFDRFLDAVAELGVPQTISRDSDDVTDKFYDLEARLKVKKDNEARLQKHLQSSTGKLDDILAVERELNRVREDIELFEGQLRRLTNLTTLTTVTVHLQEIKGYVPPQTPTFGATISNTFSESLSGLTQFGKGLVLTVVALAPWLPVLAILGVPLWLFWRGRRRRVATPPTAVAQHG